MKRVIQTLFLITIFSGIVLSSSIVSADNDSVVDQINITVPVSCTISGTGMNTHNANINNGIYTPDIGTTTLHAFCNDSEGFAIYAAGYTGNEVGGTNSNKLVGTNASNNATIGTGLATTAGNPDISNWAMKLAITQDSGDTSGTNAFTIDSAPNTTGGADASFSSYHTVPNEYTKVAHKDSNTDMTTNTGGVKLTTTYAAYISKTQPADTYSGQVIYTLVHPSSIAPAAPGQIGVIYNANGSTFTGGATINQVMYASSPMYIATTPLIAKSDNVANDGTKNSSYIVDDTSTPIIATGASKMKVVIRYGLSGGTMLPVIEGNFDGQSAPGNYEMLEGPASGEMTYVFNGDAVTFYMMVDSAPTATDNQDYGYYAEVYPIYTTEQTGTEESVDFALMSASGGSYAQTNNWLGSWYVNYNNQSHVFLTESEVIDFLNENYSTLNGTNIELYRSLTFAEAFAKAGKTQNSGYYSQQDLDNSICQTVAVGQNSTVKDVRDSNTYMVGKLKDGNCWMLDNLALDPTDLATAANMNASNTNATAEAITNLLNGGSSTTGWSSAAVINTDADFTYYAIPMINNSSKDRLVISYGAGSGKVGLYYNYCAATASTYCYVGGEGAPIDAEQDICPANWKMPTADDYTELSFKYSSVATETDSFQHNLSTSLSGRYYGRSVYDRDSCGYWWSSSYDYVGINGYAMLFLTVDSMNVNPGYNNGGRSHGQSMRCLVSE